MKHKAAGHNALAIRKHKRDRRWKEVIKPQDQSPVTDCLPPVIVREAPEVSKQNNLLPLSLVTYHALEVVQDLEKVISHVPGNSFPAA